MTELIQNILKLGEIEVELVSQVSGWLGFAISMDMGDLGFREVIRPRLTLEWPE